MSTLKTNKLVHTANGASEFTLPQTDGSPGQVLKTDGSGNLSWTTPSAGKILQIKQSMKTDDDSRSTNTFADIVGTDETGAGSVWEVNITPTAANSKILYRGILNVSGNNNAYGNIRAMRGSTAIGISTANSVAAGNSTLSFVTLNIGSVTSTGRLQVFTKVFEILDTPTYTLGDTLTYSVQWHAGYSSIYINRPQFEASSNSVHSTISTLTVEEVSA